jgi:uncharacterized protein (TIGR04222 family)
MPVGHPEGMEILLVAGLLGVAVLVLTLPWGRRDPAAFSAADVGYVRGGPRGAVLAVLGVLYLEGRVQVREGRRGFRRTDVPLPEDAEPLVRAVYAALASPARLRTILGAWGVRRAIEASATTVYAARLRTGEWQRFGGTAAAFAAVVVAVVALFAEGVDLLGGGVAVVAVIGAFLLWRGRFVTIAGRRLVAGVRRSTDLDLPAPPARRVRREKELIHADTHLDIHPAVFLYAAAHLGVAIGLGAQLLSGDDWPDELSGGTEFGSDGGYSGGYSDGGGSGDGGGFSDGGGGGDSGY